MLSFPSNADRCRPSNQGLKYGSFHPRLEQSETFAQHENRTFMVDMLYHVLRIYVIESVIIKWEPSYLSRYAIFRLVGNRSVLSQPAKWAVTRRRSRQEIRTALIGF